MLLAAARPCRERSLPPAGVVPAGAGRALRAQPFHRPCQLAPLLLRRVQPLLGEILAAVPLPARAAG